MALKTFLIIVLNLFPLSELFLAIVKRADSNNARVHDSGSLKMIWLCILGALAMAVVARYTVQLPLAMDISKIEMGSTLFVLCGMILRWSSIAILGRNFTVNVAIIDGHRLVERGPYRWIRNPSYTGLLISFVGVGIYFNNLLSLLVLMLPIWWAVARRIKVEDEILREVFGAAYSEYCRRTKSLIPFVW